MIKIKDFIKKYALFILVCFVPLLVDAASWGTLSPGAVKKGSHAWWDVFDCTTNKTGPFTFEIVSTPYYGKKSYYRSVKVTVDDYVPEAINNITTTCTYYDVLQGDPNLDSGRITRHSTVTYTYSIAAGGTPTTTTNAKTYYIYRDQTIDLADKLGIRSIESMTHTSGSEHNTVGFSGCAAGTSACSITFARGTAMHNRMHVFKIKYVNVAGKTYETTVNVYEQSNTRTDSIGTIDPGEHTFSIYDENTSNFTCSKVSDGPYEVDEDIAANGTSGRIKVTSTNYSINSYSALQAKCTFQKDGVTHTNYYIFSLSGSRATVKDAEYTANGGETFNLWSSLNMKQIVSSTANFGSNATITGCNVGSTSCSVKMKDAVTDGRTTSSTIIYYDQSNVLTQSTITIKEQVLSITENLNTIGVNNTVSRNISASGVTCTTNSVGPFTKKLEAVSGGYVLSVTNNNTTYKTYNNLSITCEGTPNAVGGKTYKYIFTFGLANQTTPIVNSKSYELFPGESLNFKGLLAIKTVKDFDYKTGSQHNVFSTFGCNDGDSACSLSFVSPNGEHNRKHEIVLTYVNDADILYKTNIEIIEKDPNFTTKAYPGLLGFCDFDDDWEYAQWNDASGKRYSYFEAKVRGAKLPECNAETNNGLWLEFKGWTKGYKAGDALTTKTSCGTDLLQPGQPTDYGNNYAPCYELKPHVRLTVNSGRLKDSENKFKFNSSDMTYIATGTDVNQTVKLPEVEYVGFSSTKKLLHWRNTYTGDIAQPGDMVKLDGSVWAAETERTVSQVDLYKSIGVGEKKPFTVAKMNGCSLAGGSSYLSATYTNGVCWIEGLAVTPFDVYANVTITFTDGTSRVYKYSVEDRAKIDDDDNGIFNADVDENIIIGKNDESTLNDYKTDQCENFFISRTGYVKYHFADSISNSEGMNTGIYSVYQLCPTDMSTYVGLCLDPGRRGPNESGTGTDTRKINYKGTEITVKGNEYTKTNEIKKDSNFGKLVMYIVKNLGINDFDSNSGGAIQRRAAAHVAVRSMAIVEGFSEVPDPSDEVYSTHYYPYQGIAGVLRDAVSDNDVTEEEAKKAVYNGSKCDINGTLTSCGFKNWKDNVDVLLVEILSRFDNSNTNSPTDGFERTIDDKEMTEVGNGYTINYKGTITAPTGATATMSTCRNPGAYGVQCIKNEFREISEESNRKTYYYDVTIKVADAKVVQPPTTVEQEKDLSFQIEYSGGHDLVNAFIASPYNGTDNVQRMLIISTSNPKIYVYFSVVPDTCDMEILKTRKPNCTISGSEDCNKCSDKDECNASIASGSFNANLFKAAGCCKYELDETSYIYKSICSADCTSSTLTSVCNYTASGDKGADFYEINEGSKYIGDDASKKAVYEDNIGTCIVDVQDYYVNDEANALESIKNTDLFTKYDDGDNLINVEAYKNNRYCQVTCEEDWEFSMDSFGNFIGNDAVAAGTYFQIVNNDMFMGAKRTCYTTFINYDRFMANIVDLSNLVVAEYNKYSEWSHVWTDIDEQKTAGYLTSQNSSDTLNYFDGSDGIVCVEYFDECPDNTIGSLLTSSSYDKYDYYYNGTDLSTSCKSINYSGIGTVTSSRCETPEDEDGAWYSDASPTLVRGTGQNAPADTSNKSTTRCDFFRTYCDDGGIKSSNGNTGDAHETYSDGKCHYNVYEARKSTSRTRDEEPRPTKTCAEGVTGPCYDSCPDGWYASGSICYQYVCDDEDYPTMIGTKCYASCHSITNPETGGSVSSSLVYGDNKKCYISVSTGTHTKHVQSLPKYKYTPLRCKTWGKVYDYSLKTENDIETLNKDNEDIYYSTVEKDPVDLAGKASDGTGDNNTQNEHKDGTDVKGYYGKEFYYDCNITAATVALGAVGSSGCSETKDYIFGADSTIICSDGNYSTATGTNERFCEAGGGADYDDKNNDADKDTTDYHDNSKAFDFMTDKALEEAKNTLDGHRSQMTSYQSRIYSHAKDIFNCQHFQLHNRTDDSIVGRKNNDVPEDTIMGMKSSYIKINTDFDPTGSYTYDEDFFMERVDKDNILVQYTEKNDAVFGSEGAYANASGEQKDAKIITPSGEVDTKLSRNFIETFYYNPEFPWNGTENEEEIKAYHQDSSKVTSPERSSKQIVLCSIGVESKGTGYATGKDGAVIPFAATAATPEWLGGRCFEVTVDYKKVHYVKSSISNSSYYKNKGNWYVRGGDSKIHGEDISDAISKFNRIQPEGYVKDYVNNNEEYKRWSRLGSFNVFPISMATPRNLYQYTYTFGNIGSYFNGDLGRIMGTEKSIIQNNTRTCFYEVFEEVCLCCGYRIEPGDLVESFVNKYGGNINEGSDISAAGGGTSGTISFYTNSVSLGNIGLGRDDSTLGSNWSVDSPFMYNGDDSLKTDKGHQLKENIEYTGENIYAREAEYKYFLTPDTLKQIRSYNDANGYDLNLDKMIVYDVSMIACDGTSNSSDCEYSGSMNDKEKTETMNFQHYGSKFLVGDIDGGYSINLVNEGSIKNSNDKVCAILDTDYDKDYDISTLINSGCRWVDYIETDNDNYYNPTSKQDEEKWFRLAFK